MSLEKKSIRPILFAAPVADACGENSPELSGGHPDHQKMPDENHIMEEMRCRPNVVFIDAQSGVDITCGDLRTVPPRHYYYVPRPFCGQNDPDNTSFLLDSALMS